MSVKPKLVTVAAKIDSPAFTPFKEIAREKRTCSKHGDYEAVQVKVFGSTQWQGCEKCEREERDTEQRIEQDKRFNQRIEFARIPLRFRDKGFTEYRAESAGQQRALLLTSAYAKDFASQLKEGRCLVLVGAAGTGKTHLALAIAKDVIRQGFTARYVTVHEAIEAIRETWRSDSVEPESAVVKRMAGVDLLVLDEVGVQYGKESEHVELFKILNKRYNDVKPTVVLSNVSPDELSRYLGERVYDRLRENGGKVVPFDWQSERGK